MRKKRAKILRAQKANYEWGARPITAKEISDMRNSEGGLIMLDSVGGIHSVRVKKKEATSQKILR